MGTDLNKVVAYYESGLDKIVSRPVSAASNWSSSRAGRRLRGRDDLALVLKTVCVGAADRDHLADGVAGRIRESRIVPGG